MNENIQYYNSREAAKILGVNVSTIKRWTDDGKLECIRTAGGHRKFIMKHLSKFIDENRKNASKVNPFPLDNGTDQKLTSHILKGNFSVLIEYVMKQALLSNRAKVQRVLNGLYIAQFPLHVVYDHLITPILQELGHNWANGRIAITQEHLATQTIRDAINRFQGIIAVPSMKNGKALCLNLSSELHDTALKMVDHILEVRGFKVMYSGQLTPAEHFENILISFKPDRIYVSSTFVEETETLQREFDSICDQSQNQNIPVFVGGRGFDSLSFDHPIVQKRLFTFEDVYRF